MSIEFAKKSTKTFFCSIEKLTNWITFNNLCVFWSLIEDTFWLLIWKLNFQTYSRQNKNIFLKERLPLGMLSYDGYATFSKWLRDVSQAAWYGLGFSIYHYSYPSLYGYPYAPTPRVYTWYRSCDSRRGRGRLRNPVHVMQLWVFEILF